jgi:hypothetical protein
MTNPNRSVTKEDGSRVYTWTDGTEYPSVTSIIRAGVAKPNLVDWAAKQIAEAAAKDRDSLALLTKAGAQKFLLDAFHGERDTTAELGNAIHDAAEIYSRSRKKPLIIAPEIVPSINQFSDFLRKVKPIYHETEVTVYSRKYGFAGTGDAIVEIDGVIYVLDIKSGKSVWPEVALQLAAYSRADFIGLPDGTEKPLSVNLKRGLVLHLRPDRWSLDYWDIGDEVFDCFLAAQDMHYWATYLSTYARIGRVEI